MTEAMRVGVDAYPTRKADRPQWLERQDPVVYNQVLNQEVIDKEQLAFYEENGYLFFESFFTDGEVAAYKSELKQLLEDSRNTDRPEIVREPGSDEVRSVFAVHRSNEVFRELTAHPRLQAVVQQILGGPVYVHQSRINFKPGFTGKEFYWHSDFETWHAEDGMPRMRALSCSLALEDNTIFNGSLMVVPGSHRVFVSCVGATPDNHYRDSLRKQEIGVPDQESLTKLVEQYGLKMPVGKAGSLLLFDCNLMHGSSGNISPLPRSNVFCVFNSVENRLEEPFSAAQPRPDFIATRSE
ncbi:ectoine hydroxylase [Cohnella lubricantis]|uniref:Ectoine hydroxylase n=1 Tax=Cohnella lubricantis TaxID=2163172 RepID=A0A841TG21_9BACL|nr:ectoine hydroxylase [Cohnella lubricantis]MBB6678218.1 ectoine hydroxylase [Cohnella lubricantis]MBP2120073.1 ectoine hydroxylase [Cohnella lubricantis]